MARTIEEIYDALVAEKETLDVLSGLQPDPDDSQTFLQDLTSNSRVAIWRLWLYVTAYGHHVIEVLHDRHVAAVEALRYTLITGTALWIRDRSLRFQLGDSLTWNGTQFAYPVISTTNQIVKRAAVTDSGGIVRIKVAKLDADGVTPVPLDAGEKTSFEAYLGQIMFAGINWICLSANADEIKITATVIYDPLVMNPDGELISDTSIKPVESAILGYIRNLPFDGVFNRNELIDAIQVAAGVVDPQLNDESLEARYGLNPFAVIENNYDSFAGHIKIADGFDLDTTITYQADAV